jgi:L-rhamnose isomerase
MPDELIPSADFFTDVRGILADARRAAYTAVLPTEAELIAELERERRVIERKRNGGDT